MRLLVCGGRNYGATLSERKFLYAELDRLKPSAVIQGGASGADARAREWARYHDIPCVTFEADWRTHGKAAGPIRNQRMLDEGKPDMVIAFPGGAGTSDMVRRAMKAKIPMTRWIDDEACNAVESTANEYESGGLMNEWQPIETAPKDGTEIIVAYPDKYGGVSVTIVSWADRPLGRHDNWDYINSHCGSPKYWQPLPKPPADGVFHGPTCNCDACIERYSDEV